MQNVYKSIELIENNFRIIYLTLTDGKEQVALIRSSEPEYLKVADSLKEKIIKAATEHYCLDDHDSVTVEALSFDPVDGVLRISVCATKKEDDDGEFDNYTMFLQLTMVTLY